MKKVLIALSLLFATNSWARPAICAKKAASKKQDVTKVADPNSVLAGSHGGKVWVLAADAAPSMEGADLGKWLSSRPAVAELTKKPTSDLWPVTLLAVFKKNPAKGPITIEIVDKSEPKVLVDRYSSQTSGTSVLFQETYDFDSNNGFNKGHSYVVKIGQIIKNRFVPYASGEVALK